jgi:dTDP-4-dehydrorhamnose reductase
MIGGVDASNFDTVIKAISVVRPDVVVNCIGVIKQTAAASDPIISLGINSILPHQLANHCRLLRICLIHISTDCVFSGKKGDYSEDDISDAEDLYGKSKYLGEVGGDSCLTIRTSIIGRELSTRWGLVEWFLAQRGKNVEGYAKAVFSGFTTIALGRVLIDVIQNHPTLHGIYHVSGHPINKYDLLVGLREAFNLSTVIEPHFEIAIDRSLNSSKFRRATGFKPEPWNQMLTELAEDAAIYEHWRSLC